MEPTGDEVGAQLERLLASEALAGSARLRRFLSFIVERALAGEGQQLKEYTVGLEVFDRGEDYDPRVDSIVRVEAGRLRARLDEYYRGAGNGDAVVVRIPRGGYTPVFEYRVAAPVADSPSSEASGSPVSPGRRLWWLAGGSAAAAMVVVTLGQLPRSHAAVEAPPRRSDPVAAVTVPPAPASAPAATAPAVNASAAPVRPAPPKVSAKRKPAPASAPDQNGSSLPEPVPGIRVAVLPFVHYSPDPAVDLVAARLTDGVMSELVRTGRVQVISRTSTMQFASGPRSLRDVARALNAALVIEATVHVDGPRVRVQMRIVDPDREVKRSLHEFDGTGQDLDDLQRRIAAAITFGAPVRDGVARR